MYQQQQIRKVEVYVTHKTGTFSCLYCARIVSKHEYKDGGNGYHISVTPCISDCSPFLAIVLFSIHKPPRSRTRDTERHDYHHTVPAQFVPSLIERA